MSPNPQFNTAPNAQMPPPQNAPQIKSAAPMPEFKAPLSPSAPPQPFQDLTPIGNEPPLMPELPVPSNAPVPPTFPLAPTGVRFEVEGIKPSLNTVQLRVVLRNNQDTPLQIPSGLKAVVSDTGKPDFSVKPDFSGSVVPAHGELHGTVKIPSKQLSPSADLVLPDILPGQGGDRSLHLITPISWAK
jgi:hypothetical protein